MPSVSFEVERPAAFQRAHVFLRIALLIVLGWLGLTDDPVAPYNRTTGLLTYELAKKPAYAAYKAAK